MQVGNHEVTFIFILHTHVIPDRSKIITQVQEAGAPDSTHNYSFLAFFHKESEVKVQDTRYKAQEQGTRFKVQGRYKDQEIFNLLDSASSSWALIIGSCLDLESWFLVLGTFLNLAP